MILRFSALIAVLMVAMVAVGQVPAPAPQQVSSGFLEFYPNFKSQYITPRNVTVWLPDGYIPGEECDVIYMHDGQMLFDAVTTWNKQEWKVDEVLGRLIAAGKIRRCIVVGIDNSDNRLNDYFPTGCYKHVPQSKREKVNVENYKGDEYLRFLVEEVKPFIDKRYMPLTGREHTFVLGSSMGGLISLYALCEYPRVFGGAVCMSTHLSMQFFSPDFDNEAWAQGFREYVKEKLPAAAGAKLYMDRGTVELDGTYGPYQYKLDDVIMALGWDSEHYKSLVFEGHKHMETYWAERLDVPLLFMLNK